MPSFIRRFAGPIIAFLTAAGLQVGGFQNIWVAYVCFAVAFVWALVAVVTWPAIHISVPRRNDIKIMFCDDRGKPIEHPPEARYWNVSAGQITYYIQGYFRLANHGKRERTVEGGYLVLVANGRELKREQINNVAGERIRPLDATLNPVAFSKQFLVDEYELQQLVGLHYEKARVKLIIEAIGTKAKVQFRSNYESLL